MISKNNIKLIKSLANVKKRREKGLFVIEGEKIVHELLLSDFKVQMVFATEKWVQENSRFEKQCTLVSPKELSKVSQLKTPNQVLTISELPEYIPEFKNFENQLCILLDNLKDPGNLGTLIRICNWYGIEHIICSTNSVDAFNSKVVQASMGAILRVKIYYVDLVTFLKEYKSICPHKVTGAFLQGESIYEAKLEEHGLIVLGNESHGISEAISALIDQKITIPPYPSHKASMESLNVASAGAIIISEHRRRRPG